MNDKMKIRHHHSLPSPPCAREMLSRRGFLKSAVLAGTAIPVLGYGHLAHAAEVKTPPRTPTTIGFCHRYDYPDVRGTLASMLDELGSIRQLVKNKFVTVKLNLVNTSKEDVGGVPIELAQTTHPVVAMALGSLLVDYGAKRVTYCDQLPFAELGAESFVGYGYNAALFDQELKGKARFINTRNRGEDPYELVKVPGGGEIASAWEVHSIYHKTDLLVSLGKLKSHVAGGITAGMKNLFGIPPSSLYGDDLGAEPDESAIGYRSSTMHTCTKKPRTSIETFTGKTVEQDHGFNVPRFIVDLNAAFPPSLVVVDAICTMETAEGWWNGSMVSLCSPQLLIAGTNAVCTDAVCASVMGFDSDADHRTHPFVNGSNCLRLAREKGLGENRIENLEVGGIGLKQARFDFMPTYQRQGSKS